MAWAIMTRDSEGGVNICGIVFKYEVDAEEHADTYTATGEFVDVWLEYVTLCGYEEDLQ